MDTIIIAAFPLCGKTWCHDYSCTLDRTSLDSDSSKFHWITHAIADEEGNPIVTKDENPDFPENYVEHIKNNIGKYDFIFVSTHESVLDALDAAGLDYVLVYPEKQLMEEWIGRYWVRSLKDKNGFDVNKLYKMWRVWINSLDGRAKAHRAYKLKSCQHLSNVIFKIEKDAG